VVQREPNLSNSNTVSYGGQTKNMVQRSNKERYTKGVQKNGYNKNLHEKTDKNAEGFAL
jgi:hypothetical protein